MEFLDREGIKFSTFSGVEIQKSAEVQVYSQEFYDSSLKPKSGALLDSRMGPANKSGHCTTCHTGYEKCPGHFGYLKLILPVFNTGYFDAIINILKCICKSCARVLLPENERKELLRKMRHLSAADHKSQQWKKIRDKCNKISQCPRCGYINGTVKKDTKNFMTIIQDFSKSNTDKNVEECKSAISHMRDVKTPIRMFHGLNPVRVLELFKRMLDEDCEVLNLSDRPEKLIVTDIAVPPVVIRPSVITDFGAASNENDITARLRKIITANSLLRASLDESSSISKCMDIWSHLQVECALYINSDVRGLPIGASLAKKENGFVQRLNGKQGRFRCNLSGKRVEFTGRTVISPDPNLKITEVAIPILMARVLTYPERVSNHNIEKLRQCVRNGSYKYPGANFVIRPDGTKQNLKFGQRNNIANELRCDYIVERHLEDGDIVLFNRQPSLHRMSIMCHRARIMPWRTLRFNESVCNPYNADFDGDEMNLHVPQTEEARTEAIILMGVQNNLCTPKNGEILVASTQDFLTSSFLITRKDTFYDRSAFCLMCSFMGDGMDPIDLPTPALIKPMELWTGKQLFSVLLRPYAQMKVFVNLTLMEKSYDKRQGRETMCPNDAFVYFRNSDLLCGQLGKATLGNGNKDGLFSVLLRDYNSHAAASCMNRLAKLSARWIGNHGFSIGIDDVQPGHHLNLRKKETIEKSYEKCDNLICSFNKGELVLQPGCNAAQTLESQITGELNKIRQDTADVCMKELHWRNSPLIMSQCGSKGSPINISQMIACVGQQSVGGRRAPDGFIDRTLPHFPKSSKTPSVCFLDQEYDAKGFVANSFYTGLTATEFFFHTMAGREGLVDTAVKTAETGYMSRRLIKSLEDLSTYYDETVRNSSGGIVQLLYGDDGMDPAKMEANEGKPLNFSQLFLKVKATCPARRQDLLCSSEVIKISEDILTKHEDLISAQFKTDLLNFVSNQVTLLRKTRTLLELDENSIANEGSNILEKVAANISGISSKQLQVFLGTCLARYQSKRVEAGAAIGAIGAQSIGEPGTQMTLKTFHFAGVASMNITLGVPRIKEIINATKNISTPIITAILVCDNDVRSARIVKGHIEKTVLGQVAKSIKTILKPIQACVVIKLDLEQIKALHMGITVDSVRQSILSHPRIKLKDSHVLAICADKLRIFSPETDKKKLLFELHHLMTILPNVIVKGISTVERAVINKDKDKYSLLVEGTNLLAVMGTQGVKGCETKSNHIIEVWGTLGIEAARKSIIDEMQYTMKSHGMSIDIRHMNLLADVMTYKGEVLGITRFGLVKMKASVLMLASFEQTASHLFNASVNGRDDKIEGVSECIIMGIPMRLGTGILKVKQRYLLIVNYYLGTFMFLSSNLTSLET
ncbi:DNA-directed RNA polymerase II subunit RPB1 [Acorus gramineus]|uniref:DNA-directed RNA polymerase subunit n=1 Tax=Acorus gramineus TaxID=55184 RepID=A0AAV9B573_ACOGR|nr:DNA-directed RNA polymerase II subunit RPB1 [Acorus gramineus]